MKLFPVSFLLILSLFLSRTAESYDVEDNAIAMTFLDIYGEEAKIDEAVTGDFNGDGVMDLAVCARSFSTSTAPTRRDDFFRQLALRLKSKQQSEGLHWH